MKGTIKKQMRRLYKALETDNEFEYGDYNIPAKKPLSGKSARYLVGKNYNRLDNEFGWVFCARPKFANGHKYVLYADLREHVNRPALIVSRV